MFCQLPVESQVWASLPLQRVVVGAQVPVHAPAAHTKGQGEGASQVPAALHVWRSLAWHRVVAGAHAPLAASPPLLLLLLLEPELLAPPELEPLLLPLLPPLLLEPAPLDPLEPEPPLPELDVASSAAPASPPCTTSPSPHRLAHAPRNTTGLATTATSERRRSAVKSSLSR